MNRMPGDGNGRKNHTQNLNHFTKNIINGYNFYRGYPESKSRKSNKN